MKFMMMHKMTEAMEQGTPPTPEQLEAIGALMGEAAAAGVFLSGEGLKPTRERLRVVYRGGARRITEGPLDDARDLLGGFALLSVRSCDDALAWLDELAAALGDVELYLGPVVEMWDLGMGVQPEDAPARFLATYQGPEGDRPLAPEVAKRVQALFGRSRAAGMVQAASMLAPTKHGARIRYRDGKRTVTDGPFAETKELIAGYAIYDLPSMQEAVTWACRFGDLGGVEETDIRLMED